MRLVKIKTKSRGWLPPNTTDSDVTAALRYIIAEAMVEQEEISDLLFLCKGPKGSYFVSTIRYNSKPDKTMPANGEMGGCWYVDHAKESYCMPIDCLNELHLIIEE